jgi:hypothetical protein
MAGAAAASRYLGVDFGVTSTTQKFPLGMRVTANDGRTYRYGKAGAVVAINSALKIDVAEGPNDVDPITAADQVIAGVAHVAAADNEFFWYVVNGPVSVLAAATVVAGAPAVTIATAGTLDDTAGTTSNALAAGSGVGVVFTSTTSSGLASVQLYG